MVHKPITLTSLADGAAEELFQHELNRVLENIFDVNTDPEQKRSITLKATFSPKENKDGARDTSDVELEVSAKLAGVRSVATGLFLAKRAGHPVAVEATAKQVTLEFEEEGKPRAVRDEEEVN